MSQIPRSRLALPSAMLLLFSAGCGGSKDEAKVPSSDTLPTAIEHEACDVGSSSAQKFDTNGDGKPDIVRVMSDGREVCRMVDLNHDEKPDSFIYFDSSGNIRRKESDFDRDGRVDEIAYYKAGVIARKDRETNLDGKLDTWDFYEGGKIHHRLRDSDGDGKVDQWWTWANPDKVECAVIASDHNGDGKPDPNNVIDICASGTPTLAPADGGVATMNAGDGGAALAASTTMPSGSEAGALAVGAAPADAGRGTATSAASAEGSASKKAADKRKKETK